jgi:hypothetical protein
LPAPASSSGVSICTFVLVKQSEHLLRGIRCDCLRLLRRGPVCRGMRLQLLRRQYLYFCTSKVSKASKPPVARAAGAAVHTHARANAAAHAAAHMYFCASKASKLAARAAVHTHTHARAHAAVCTSKASKLRDEEERFHLLRMRLARLCIRIRMTRILALMQVHRRRHILGMPLLRTRWAQFTCFSSTKVHILTSEELQAGAQAAAHT